MQAEEAESHYTDANSAFKTICAVEEPWIELFHSRPSWKVCQISYSKDDGKSWVPFSMYKFLDAASTKPGFRVFRIQAKTLQFKLANSNASVLDMNDGRNYHISQPGRYVVESGSGCRRVSDSQIADCLRPLRRNDKFIELTLKPSAKSTWRNCHITYKLHHSSRVEDGWFTAPMNRSATLLDAWVSTIEAPEGIECAFNDGGTEWDSNNSNNYHMTLPGKYSLGNGSMEYVGASNIDLHVGQVY